MHAGACWLQVLGIAQSADEAAIKKGYRVQALQWHPGVVFREFHACKSPPHAVWCHARQAAASGATAARLQLTFRGSTALQTRTSTGWRRRTSASRRSPTPTRSSATSTSAPGMALLLRCPVERPPACSAATACLLPTLHDASHPSTHAKYGYDIRSAAASRVELRSHRAPILCAARYDSHRDNIMRAGSHQTGSWGFSGPKRPDDEEDLFSYFSSRCFSGYGDDKHVRRHAAWLLIVDLSLGRPALGQASSGWRMR